jgi:hypothetical protein
LQPAHSFVFIDSAGTSGAGFPESVSICANKASSPLPTPPPGGGAFGSSEEIIGLLVALPSSKKSKILCLIL